MKKDKKSLDNKLPFEIVPNDYSIWKQPKAILSYKGELDHCPACDSILKKDFTLIPISSEEKAKINGLVCSRCQCLYSKERSVVEGILRDKEYAKDFSLNGKYLWNFSQLKKEKKRKKTYQKNLSRQRSYLEQIPSSEMMICIKYDNNISDEIVIVTSLENAKMTENIVHYASDEGREFISAAVEPSRNHQGEIDNTKYRVVGEPIFKSEQEALPTYISPTELLIKSGGGYSRSIVNNKYELVDILLYSPFTKRYEIIKATRNKDAKEYFVDISRFRSFINEYGKPKISFSFEGCTSYGKSFDKLRNESILRQYGYRVNQKDNIPDKNRQERLAEIMDLEIMEPLSIVHFIEFLIASHPNNIIAQSKWLCDKKFVENYKVDTTRFLILKQP